MKAILGTTVLSLSALLSTTAFAQDTTFTINSFGGAYETAHRACIITPFEEETGVSVNVVTAYSADAFAQLRAQKDAPQFDVIHFSGGQEIVGAAEGLLAPIDAASLTNAADVYDFAKANLAKGEGPAYSIAASATGELTSSPQRSGSLFECVKLCLPAIMCEAGCTPKFWREKKSAPWVQKWRAEASLLCRHQVDAVNGRTK